MSTFKRHNYNPLEGKTCPVCETTFRFCEVEGCEEFAIYEGWVKCGIMLTRRLLCKEHVQLTEAYKKKGEKVFEEAELAYKGGN